MTDERLQESKLAEFVSDYDRVVALAVRQRTALEAALRFVEDELDRRRAGEYELPGYHEECRRLAEAERAQRVILAALVGEVG